MKTQKNEVYPLKKHIINTTVALAISIIITFMFGGIGGGWQNIVLNIVYGVLIGLSIALGCGIISTKMLSGDKWMNNPAKRHIHVMLAIMGYILADVLIINTVWFYITQDVTIWGLFYSGFFLWLILTEFTIGLVIYLIILSSRFVKHLNDFYLETQKAKEEAAKYKLATLKNQINPHFLFNSLNVLSGMVHADAEQADDFIERLSGIYRYVLDVQEEDVVPLKKEIDFAKDYLHLLSLRFGNNLKYEINSNGEGYIVPMSLQLLIENAVKHNLITPEKPLNIKITTDNEIIFVSNNIQPKSETADGSETGLDNIRNRYKYLTDKEIIVQNNGKEFVVKLPVLKLDKA